MKPDLKVMKPLINVGRSKFPDVTRMTSPADWRSVGCGLRIASPAEEARRVGGTAAAVGWRRESKKSFLLSKRRKSLINF